MARPRWSRGVVLAGCAAMGLGAGTAIERDAALPAAQDPSSRPVRVALAFPRSAAPLDASAPWELLDQGRRAIARGRPGEPWRLERERGRLRVVSPAGAASPWYQETVTMQPLDSTEFVRWSGRSFRGVLQFVPAETSLVVVNRLDVEDYLRGVVPLEVGTSQADDHAAVEAQAVAARSFTYTRMLYGTARHYDLTASELDQVYGGVAVETFIGDLAVAATAGWVLAVAGRVVIAPYHAICGGHTAAPTEVWRTSGDTFLRAVSDRVPGGERAYCEIAPRFAWERRLEASAVAASLERGAPGASNGARAAGAVRQARVEGTTPSGRVRALTFTTERGDVTLRGNDIRFALRGVGGDILPSTYFSLQPETDQTGRLVRLVLRGRGNGHGVGMCQWGAIGRARAGHDFRAILRAYYPGAQLLRAP